MFPKTRSEQNGGGAPIGASTGVANGDIEACTDASKEARRMLVGHQILLLGSPSDVLDKPVADHAPTVLPGSR